MIIRYIKLFHRNILILIYFVLIQHFLFLINSASSQISSYSEKNSDQNQSFFRSFRTFLDYQDFYTSEDTKVISQNSQYSVERYRRFREIFPKLFELVEKQKKTNETQYLIFYRWSKKRANLMLTQDGFLNDKNGAFYFDNKEGNIQFEGVGLYFSARPLDNLGYGDDLMEIFIPIDILLSNQKLILDDQSGDVKDGFVLKMDALKRVYGDLQKSKIRFQKFCGESLTTEQIKYIYQEVGHYLGLKWRTDYKEQFESCFQ
jgi:hypothetical protein